MYKTIVTLFVTCFILFIYACDQSFEPFRDNDEFIYSMAGFLDASEDKQWVRVIDLQNPVNREGEGINGKVYIRDLENGPMKLMDSNLYQFNERTFAYNFSTDFSIEEEGIYEIIAEREDGLQSRTMVSIPATFEAPEFVESFYPNDPDGLRIRGVEYLAEVSIRFQVLYPISGTTENRKVLLNDYLIEIDKDEYLVPVYPDLIDNSLSGLNDVSGDVEVINCEFFVAKGGEDLERFDSIDDNELTVPNGVSNVNRGTGYILGVISKKIPFPNRACTDQ